MLCSSFDTEHTLINRNLEKSVLNCTCEEKLLREFLDVVYPMSTTNLDIQGARCNNLNQVSLRSVPINNFPPCTSGKMFSMFSPFLLVSWKRELYLKKIAYQKDYSYRFQCFFTRRQKSVFISELKNKLTVMRFSRSTYFSLFLNSRHLSIKNAKISGFLFNSCILCSVFTNLWYRHKNCQFFTVNCRVSF